MNANKTKFDAPWLYREEFGLDPGRGSCFKVRANKHMTSRRELMIYRSTAPWWCVEGYLTQVGSYGGQKKLRSWNMSSWEVSVFSTRLIQLNCA